MSAVPSPARSPAETLSPRLDPTGTPPIVRTACQPAGPASESTTTLPGPRVAGVATSWSTPLPWKSAAARFRPTALRSPAGTNGAPIATGVTGWLSGPSAIADGSCRKVHTETLFEYFAEMASSEMPSLLKSPSATSSGPADGRNGSGIVASTRGAVPVARLESDWPKPL